MAGELATTGGGYTQEQIEIIKTQICRGANNDEMKMFLMVCQRSGLDPFARQIHAVKRWNPKTQREDMTIQTGIDGFRLIAERTGKYAGNDDPVYDTEDAPHPKKASVTVWKTVNGQRVPFTRSARWSEFVQTKKDGSVTKFWASMPYLMLGKVAEALALRTAFPQELSGLYTSDEMGQADNDAAEAIPAHQSPRPQPQVQQQQPKPQALPPRPQPEPEVIDPEWDAPQETAPAVDVAALVKAATTLSDMGHIANQVAAVNTLYSGGQVNDNDMALLIPIWYSRSLHCAKSLNGKTMAEYEQVTATLKQSVIGMFTATQKKGVAEAFAAVKQQIEAAGKPAPEPEPDPLFG